MVNTTRSIAGIAGGRRRARRGCRWDYQFPDLDGRWRLIRGTWRSRDYAGPGDEASLAIASEDYKTAFADFAEMMSARPARQRYPASSRVQGGFSACPPRKCGMAAEFHAPGRGARFNSTLGSA